ncbi:MAG: hypothetical protein K0R39_223 [Symbiobacteriaceae bacterium]|jgi:hypothetical protein|nr:hypothetical protein [Symbiobacteriaceae bacterium]
MRYNWWMAPLAVLLVLAGVAGGLLLSRPRATLAQVPGKVNAPPVTKPGAGAPGPSKPSQPTPTEPAQPPQSEPAQPTEPAEPEPQRPADSEALAFIRTFMKARMAGDAGKVSGMVLPQAVGRGSIRLSGPGARITGYTADLLGSGDMDRFVFRVSVGFGTGQPGGEVAAEEIALTWKGGLKVAAFAERAQDSLAMGVGQDGTLYLHKGQSATLAGDLAMLPDQAKPRGAEPGIEFGVGKEGWSVAAVNMAGTHVLWVTKGLHPLMGISQITWGSNPVMTPIDLLFEAGGVDAAWAPGSSRYVAVAIAEPSGATTLAVIDAMGPGKVVPDLAAKLGGAPDYTVRNLRWLSGTVVAFEVERGGKTTGPYTYDVGTNALTTP